MYRLKILAIGAVVNCTWPTSSFSMEDGDLYIGMDPVQSSSPIRSGFKKPTGQNTELKEFIDLKTKYPKAINFFLEKKL